jgi:hypothetical protein
LQTEFLLPIRQTVDIFVDAGICMVSTHSF